MVLSMIDLTTLEGMDTAGKVRQLCYKARHLHDAVPGLPTVAAVCVYPNFVELAKSEVAETGIKVASVATAFPSGNSFLYSLGLYNGCFSCCVYFFNCHSTNRY